jgi:phosphatidylinositol 4-kinase
MSMTSSCHLASLGNLSDGTSDRAKILASQLATKGYFAGEAAGLRLASREGE